MTICAQFRPFLISRVASYLVMAQDMMSETSLDRRPLLVSVTFLASLLLTKYEHSQSRGHFIPICVFDDFLIRYNFQSENTPTHVDDS